MGWFLSRSDAVSPARAVARPVLLLCGVWGAPFLTHCFVMEVTLFLVVLMSSV